MPSKRYRNPYLNARMSKLSSRRHPDRDLCARVEAEFVHDVADVGGHRPVGDEQPCTDLLVAQPLGDQAPDLDFSLCEWPRNKAVSRFGADAIEFAQRELQRSFAAQLFTSVELMVVRRCSQRRDRGLFGLAQEWHRRSHYV